MGEGGLGEGGFCAGGADLRAENPELARFGVGGGPTVFGFDLPGFPWGTLLIVETAE